MSLRRTRAIARKELLHILRDPLSLLMALVLPALILLLFGYALTLDVDRIPILICDLDASPQSRELVSRFEGTRYFSIAGYLERPAAAERALDRGDVLAALVIPPDFSRSLHTGRPAHVQLLLDGADSNTAAIALGYAQSVVQSYSLTAGWNSAAPERGNPSLNPVQLELRVWYNSDLESKNSIVPGLVAVILMLIAALLTSLTIAREREMGTFEQLLSTPVRPAELVLGKMSAYFVLGVIDTLTAILVGVFIFKVPFLGSLLLLGISCFIFLFGALCWGILISSVADSQVQAYQLGMVSSFLPAFLLSGFVFAIENMPLPIQIITYVVPARYFITILKGLFLKGIGMEFLAWEMVFLIVFASSVFLLATRRLKAKIL